MGMLKKAASGVLAILPTFGLTDLPLFAAFALTYSMYAPRVKMAAVLPVDERVLARLGWAGQTTDFFEHSLQLMEVVSSWACICHGSEIFNRPLI